MQLVVFHYHDRPGGVREVIRRGLPLLLGRMTGVAEVVLVMGEVSDPAWVADLAATVRPARLRVEVRADFGYLSGGDQRMSAESVRVFRSILSRPGTVVWAHNLSVGRNIPLLMALPAWCAAAGARLWMHHHDWWWDGRWDRMADWRAAGVRGLGKALACSVPGSGEVSHFCVNRADVDWVRRQAAGPVRWVGNPLPELTMPDGESVREARRWLRKLTGGREVWLAPVRALRRKNLAEAIYLASSRGGEVAVVTSGGPGAGVEGAGWDRLRAAAAEKGWAFFPSVMQGAGGGGGNGSSGGGGGGARAFLGGIRALIAAADVVVMPSLQEGFGLPYLEAAALGRPLLARAIPGVDENLSGMRCVLHGAYAKLPVGCGAFNIAAENRRRAVAWGRVAAVLPGELVTGAGGVREMEPGSIGMRDAGQGGALEVVSKWTPGQGVDFGGLTLEGQLEVLSGGSGLPIEAVPSPRVPDWAEAGKEDRWADRFFGDFGRGAAMGDDDDDAGAVDSAGAGAGVGVGVGVGAAAAAAAAAGRETTGHNAPGSCEGVVIEVRRRFEYWRAHPLLWP